MNTSRYETNLLNLQLSIENNIGKWEMMPSFASNHMYESVPEREDSDEENSPFENQEEYQEVRGLDLDDQLGAIDNEDEENNYYSFGVDYQIDSE
jgi:hypothetical protein